MIFFSGGAWGCPSKGSNSTRLALRFVNPNKDKYSSMGKTIYKEKLLGVACRSDV